MLALFVLPTNGFTKMIGKVLLPVMRALFDGVLQNNSEIQYRSLAR